MEFNLALNTIVYIMVFVIPGILYRKFLFIKHDTKQFDSGNLFERFIFTILTSIVMLVLSFAIFSIFELLNIKLFENVSYESFKLMFEQLGNNELPEEEDFKTSYLEYAELLVAVYLISIVLGYISYFITNDKRVKSSGFFRKTNYWQDLIIKDYNNKGLDPKKQYKLIFTSVDVLTETSEGNKLYTGKVVDYFICPQTGLLRTLVLKEVFRYRKNKENIKGVDIVPVPGNLFVVHDRILNLNISYTYVEIEDEGKINNFLFFIYCLSLIFLAMSPFITFFDNYTSTIAMKIVFVFSGFFFSTSLFSLLNKLFYTPKLTKASDVLIPIMFSFFVVFSLGFIDVKLAVGLFLGTPILTGFIQYLLKKKEIQ